MSHFVILKALKIKPSCQYKIQEGRRHFFCFQGQRKVPQEKGNPSEGVMAHEKNKINPSIFQCLLRFLKSSSPSFLQG